MADIQLKLNSAGMEALLNSAELDGILEPIAEAGAATARSTAPRDSGEYADSIDVWATNTDRRVWRYGAKAPHGAVVEANTGNLARALGS